MALFLLPGWSGAQVAIDSARYLVYLADKQGTGYGLNDPSGFLSERAILRRIRQGIPVDSTDLPVNQSYVEAIRQTGAQVLKFSRWMNAVAVQADSLTLLAVMNLPVVSSGPTMVQRVKRYPSEDLAGFNPQPAAGSFDSLHYGLAWNQTSMLNLQVLHKDGYQGQGKWIGIFDSGFLVSDTLSHMDSIFKHHQVVWTQDMVNPGGNVFLTGSHGTAVLSTIGANKPGSMVGTASRARFLLFRTEDGSSETKLEELNWLLAAEVADSLGVDIINTSLSYRRFDGDGSFNYSPSDMDGRTSIISRAMVMAHRKGILCVTSAGNNAQDAAWPIVGAPADTDSILTVGSVDFDLTWSSFSALGPTADGRIKPDVMARGRQAAIVRTTDEVIPGNGTSFSGPIIAGFAASLWSAMPNLSNYSIRELVLRSASQYFQPDNQYGYGIPDYLAIRNQLLNGEKGPSVRVFPNPATRDQNLILEFSGAWIGVPVEAALYDPLGRRVWSFRGVPESSLLDLGTGARNMQGGLFILKISSPLGEETQKIVLY